MFCSVYLIYYLLSIQLFYKYVNPQSPEEDAPDCKVTFTFGYGYYTIFRLPETSLVGSEMHMKFFVRAKSDAHILLSTSGSLEDTTPVYEIVLGAGKNTFSDIRRAKRALTKTTASTPNLLSANELREFWIRITHDGVIEVGKGNEDIPFMFWQDTDPLQIKYFSFSTWTDVFGKWFYDCYINKNETSAIVRKTVTWTDRLRADLLKEYDAQVIPKINFLAQKLEIKIKMECRHVELDSKNSEIAVTSIFGMVWTDDKMNWEPSKYGGANVLQLRNGEIWQPELVLYNAVDHGAEPLSASGVVVSPTGEVMWLPTSKLKAHCKLDLSSWPWDQHTCKLKLGFWALKDFLKLVVIQNKTQISDQKSSSIWQIQAIETETAWIDTPWYNNDEDPTAVLPTDSVMVIKITVKRIASIYNYIFLVPLIVIAVVCVISFGLSPVSTEKIGMQCVCLILGSMFIIVLDNSLPSSSENVPYILKAFSESLIMVTISTAASVCVMTIIRQPHFKPPHKFLTSILSWSPLKLLFFLPEPNFDCLQKYDQLDQGEELTTDDDSSIYYWTVFASLLDRITLFITILFIFHTIFFL